LTGRVGESVAIKTGVLGGQQRVEARWKKKPEMRLKNLTLPKKGWRGLTFCERRGSTVGINFQRKPKGFREKRKGRGGSVALEPLGLTPAKAGEEKNQLGPGVL